LWLSKYPCSSLMVAGFNAVTPVLGSLAQLLTSARQAIAMANKL